MHPLVLFPAMAARGAPAAHPGMEALTDFSESRFEPPQVKTVRLEKEKVR
jgi:hypothetical protein